MSSVPASLHAAHRLARLAGWALCGGTPLLIGALILAGVIPGGGHPPEGTYLQLGHAFTGLVFLAAAWTLWRRGQVLRGFHRVPVSRRPGLLLRETLLYAALFELSSLYGLVYWVLVGRQAARHVFGFLLVGPILFLTLVPGIDQWVEAAGPADGGAS